MTTATRRSCMLFCLCVAFGAAANAAQRTFVSTSGDDLNACSLVAPCRGFAKAITVTDVNGEIVVLDSGGYGAVTVNKNVTITSPAGVYGGLSVFAGNDGITIVGPAAKVVVRGLTINGQGGNNGIRVQAGEVHVENTIISNMAAAGILVEGGSTVRISGTVARSNVDGLRVVPGAGSVSVLVRDSEFSNNATAGIGVSPSAAGANAQVTAERASVTKNGAGLAVAPGAAASATLIVVQSVASENAGAGISSAGSTATVYVRESAVTRNGTGLLQQNAGVLNACGANLLVANTTPMSGAINTGSCLDVASGSGTVTNIATGVGLTGGPITATGTINLAATNLLPAVACAANQVPKWNGAAWTCAADNDTNSGGTVTNVATGTGLTGGPINTTGTVSIANGGVGTTQLANSSVNVTKLDTTSTDARYLKQGGNAFGVPSVLGATDNQQLHIRVNNAVVMQYQPDAISPNLIGGHSGNSVDTGVHGATIGGGGAGVNTDPDPGIGSEAPNRVFVHYGTVGGGFNNRAGFAGADPNSWYASTVAGGHSNTASGYAATVAGGHGNTASGTAAVIGGGATVGGGVGNTSSSLGTTVGGGFSNTASSAFATIAGGENNAAISGDATIGGGHGNTASGFFATVPGGLDNEAAGDYSVAIGRRAKARGDGSFSFADGHDFDFSANSVNAFRVRATGGVRFVTDIDGTGATTWSCLATAGNSWACASDRNLKHSLVELDGKAVLAKLAAVPMYQWQPKGKNAHVRHYGPMAQDFHAAFGLGDDEKMIGMQDADGVAMAAIQGLHAELLDRDALIAAVRREKNRELAELRERVAQVEALRGDLASLRQALAELQQEWTRMAAR